MAPTSPRRGLQGPSVNDLGYLLGLGDGDPHRVVLLPRSDRPAGHP